MAKSISESVAKEDPNLSKTDKLESQMAELDLDGLIEDSDIPFERPVQMDPYNLRNWLQYIEHKLLNSKKQAAMLLFERAVQTLPGSYKLWKRYLLFKSSMAESLPYISNQAQYESVNRLYERSLYFLNKMPRIWINYLEFLMKQPIVSTIRRVFDRSLRDLAVTQHDKIWGLYIRFAKRVGGLTEEKILARYVSLYPQKINVLIRSLKKHKKYSEAAQKIVDCLNDPNFDKGYNASRYSYWLKLSKLIEDYPYEMTGINVEIILLEGIRRYTDISGGLWTSLAAYFISIRQFEKARDVYEQAIEQVTTVRDFTMVFDAYSMFEENSLTNTMQHAADNPEDENDLGLIDLIMARFENLINRRPYLVSRVVLKQNSNLVDEWLKRIELYENDKNISGMIDCYEEAISNITPTKAVGELSSLWIKYAEYFENTNSIDKCREIFRRATQVHFKTVAELAKIWCSFAEMEIRNDNFEEAEAVLAEAITPPSKSTFRTEIKYNDETVPPQWRVYKSLSIWQIYIDLEESSDNVSKTRAVYDRIIQLKIATPQIIVNYTSFLKEHRYFEEVFRVYERGISMFGYPVSFELWNLYLTFFVERYKGSKLERARDLFEQALNGCPGNLSKPIFIMYGKFEEEYGQTKNALSIYERACKSVTRGKLEMIKFYIARTSILLGDSHTRSIYEKAIYDLPDEQETLSLLIDYARMELKLGEIDRARALYGYASQFADPRVNSEFWELWHSFEVECGNEETFKEMLRIKRTIQTRFNTDFSYIAAQISAQKKNAQISKANQQDSQSGFTNFTKSTIPNELEAVSNTNSNSDVGNVNNPNEISGIDFDDL
ncbi:hypothetical protein BB560_003908 [Smittium megazygosporum]|uniref:Pre-mRNA-splicing factor SYF1 n=1 Tax=Smittium megazygosporum TaxID=133381 RepID=A0A2T9ZAP2_9FUNG|nr:hypothetical protein BB560_003908 [Smittium megazygosporum]